MVDILEFIYLIRDTATQEMMRIFTCGGCYKFHLILKSVFPDAIPYMIMDKEGGIVHIVSKIGNNFYDINGIYLNLDEILPMTNANIKVAETFTYPVIQQKEIKIKGMLRRRRKLALNIWWAFNVLLFVLAAAAIWHNSFNLSITIISSVLSISITIRLLIKLFFDIDSNYCPNCGRRLK